MGLLKHSDTYWKLLGQCTQCGHCTSACNSLESADMTLGKIAKSLLAAERNASNEDELRANIEADDSLVQAVRRCFFCTSCKNTCFARNDVCDLIYHARVDFQELGLIPRTEWSSVLVDQEWDIFTAYRAIHGIAFADLTRHVETDDHAAETDCEIAFFPGCSLAAYGPELTREIFGAIQEIGGKTTMIDHCCGSPLKSAGFYERAEALCDCNAREIADSGAKKLVCVCPGCANAMKATLERSGIDVEVVSLARYLLDGHFVPRQKLPDGEIWMSKACQDRDGEYLKATCRVLGLDPYTSPIFHGCCGAGGGVSAYNYGRIAHQASSKLSFAPDGATVITMCPTCTYTYASRLMDEPRDLTNKHYTELLFESQFDWNLVFYQLNSMYYGEYGPWLNEVFA